MALPTDILSGEFASEKPYEPRGPGNIVKEVYDAGLSFTGKKLWQGMLAVGASGFGKGVLVMAALVIAVAAVVTMAPAAAPELELMNGIFKGMGFLIGGSAGLTVLAIGGTLGAVAETRSHLNRLSVEQAQQLANHYEKQRQQEEARRMQPEKTAEPEKPGKSFVDEEMRRRNNPDNGMGPYV